MTVFLILSTRAMVMVVILLCVSVTALAATYLVYTLKQGAIRRFQDMLCVDH